MQGAESGTVVRHLRAPDLDGVKKHARARTPNVKREASPATIIVTHDIHHAHTIVAPRTHSRITGRPEGLSPPPPLPLSPILRYENPNASMFGWLRGRGGAGAGGAADDATPAPAPGSGGADASAGASADPAAAAAPSTAPAPCCYSRPRGGLYDRYFAWLMSRMGGAHEAKLEPLKKRLFSLLVRELLPTAKMTAATKAATAAATAAASAAPPQQQRQLSILEVGMGLGPNCARLAEALKEHGLDPCKDCRLVGVEPNRAMHQGARDAAASAGFAASPSAFDLRPLYAEHLADHFPPASFDAAVVTLVFCSVPDVPGALAALRRVVKPGGRLLLLEHVRHPDPHSRLAKAQKLLDPVWALIGDGCSLSRDTRAALREAGILAKGDNEARLVGVAEGEGGGGMAGLLPLVAGVLEM
jgi:ubiquinone/menaquinone biosynthesis C-methylase UbiE